MVTLGLPALADLVRLATDKARALWNAQGETIVAVAALLVVVFVIEVSTRGDWRRYLSRHFRTDAAYTAFYVGGVCSVVFSGPLFGLLSGAIERHAPWLQVKLLDGLPAAVQLAVLLPAMDLIAYWVHRGLHASRLLWAVHRLHHSQERLTPLTAYRVHFVEILLQNLAKFAAALLLGVPSRVWLPVALITLWVPLLAHAAAGWSFGPLDRILVSPRFHHVHHSVDAAHHDRNFAQVFSFWDDLFGTASRPAPPPTAFGVPGAAVPESFLRQLVHPFADWVRRR